MDTTTTQATAIAGRSAQTSSPSIQRALVGRRLDGWLVGGLGIVVWLGLSSARWFGAELSTGLTGPLYWLLVAIAGTHFGASYHLAYGQGRAVARERWFSMIAVPVVLVCLALAACIALATGGTAFASGLSRALLTLVFSLTGWHYVKQSYGVLRLGASLRGLKITPTTAKVLRFGLYPLWISNASRLWILPDTANVTRDGGGYELGPTFVLRVFDTVSALSGIVLVGVFVHLARSWRAMPATVWTPYAVGFLWMMFPPQWASMIIVLGAIHGLQYLACAHRAELAWGQERGVQALRPWWLAVFGGAFASGMMLAYWLPGFLNATTQETVLSTLPATMLFVIFNLHHYAVDASIWRSRDDHIRRIVHGPRLNA